MRALFYLLILAIFIFSSAQARSLIPRPSPLSSFKINTTKNAGTCSFTVYAPRLDDPRSGTFERCSTDTFEIYGPCTYQICYLYVYRSGYDGWVPYDITVYGYNSDPVTFHYNVKIPRGIWYGFNFCTGVRTVSSATE